MLLFVGGLAAPAAAQEPAADALPDGGIPVTSERVRTACGGCHRADDQGRMTRISYQRTTPEGWQQTVRRMVLLNGVELTPEDAREAVRYLATHHGLAPDEARAGAFEVERRQLDYRYEPSLATQETCNRCHSFGRVLNQRRTAEEWELLMAMHRGYYPLADFQSFQRRRSSEPGADDTDDSRSPVERAVAYLAEAFPLATSAWANWSANMGAPRLDGRWALVGHEPGHGPVYGEMVIRVDPDDAGRFTTTAAYEYVARDIDVTRSGQAVVYTGFQWRGRTESDDHIDLREVMSVSRDQNTITGRWFTGAYDERGLDVTLRRVGSEPFIAGAYPRAVPLDAGEMTLELFGANLPTTLDAADIALGGGLTVTAFTEVTSDHASLRIAVDADAPVGSRDLFVWRAALTDAVVVFDAVHRVTVAPATGLARVAGANFPKQYERFEARAYHHGPDGAPGTDDDLDLGMVDVDWSLEEYAATYDDDDLSFVGTIGGHGIFSPAEDGPNPDRRGNRNNVGDVWVVATLSTAPGGATINPPLRVRAHLLVTVPLYIRRGESAP